MVKMVDADKEIKENEEKTLEQIQEEERLEEERREIEELNKKDELIEEELSDDDPNRPGKGDKSEDDEEVVEEESEEDDSKFDYDNEGKKRGYKALFKEIEHLRKDKSSLKEQFDDIKEQIQALREAPTKTKEDTVESVMKLENLQEGIEELKDAGLPDKTIKTLLKMVEIVADKKVQPVAELASAKDYKNVLTKIGRDAKYKDVVETYRDDIEDKLEEMKVPRNLWANERTLKMALGTLQIENPRQPKKVVKKVVKRSATENKATTTTRATGTGITVKELNDFAVESGTDLNDPDERRAAIEAIRMRKKVMSKS